MTAIDLLMDEGEEQFKLRRAEDAAAAESLGWKLPEGDDDMKKEIVMGNRSEENHYHHYAKESSMKKLVPILATAALTAGGLGGIGWAMGLFDRIPRPEQKPEKPNTGIERPEEPEPDEYEYRLELE